MKTRTTLSKHDQVMIRGIIKEKTGYLIESTCILNQMFRRSSLAAETGQHSNEIFEFTGDEVLNYNVVKIISKRCSSLNLIGDYTFKIRENQFTLIKQSLVNNESLAKIIDEWGLANYLLLGKSDIKNNVTEEPKIKADLFEAIIGAIAIDSRWDSEVLETAVQRALNVDEVITSMIENDDKAKHIDIDNAISTLKELAESGQCTMPNYEFHGPETLGNDNNGNPKWACTCSVTNDVTGIKKLVFTSSKKDAKKAASYLILCDHFDMQNLYGTSGRFISWIYKDGKLFPDNSSHNNSI